MKYLRRQLQDYQPVCEQEERDREIMLAFLRDHPDCLSRENSIAHFTASSWIVNEDRDKVLMVYHNIYRSWSWTGGHADGEADLLQVALREAAEETGIAALQPLQKEPVSLEILTVDGHEKGGNYVPSHLHLNVTFLLAGDEKLPLREKPDENSAVRWIPSKQIFSLVSEPWMAERVYSKLLKL